MYIGAPCITKEDLIESASRGPNITRARSILLTKKAPETAWLLYV